MNRTLVWDIPTRLFHWLLAGSFLGAFAIAHLVDDHSSAFAIHMLLGGAIAFMVLLRIVWGLVGSRHARFRDFALSPRELLGYVKGQLTGGAGRYAGHNSGSSYAAVVMFALLLGLGLTGAFMGSGGEVVEEVHEVLAWAMIVVVGAHVAGIVVHSVRHKEFIARSMIDGKKQAEPSQAIRSAHPVVGVVFLALTGLWSWGLVSNYDPASSTLRVPLTGHALHIGEGEEGGAHGEHEDHEARDERH